MAYAINDSYFESRWKNPLKNRVFMILTESIIIKTDKETSSTNIYTYNSIKKYEETSSIGYIHIQLHKKSDNIRVFPRTSEVREYIRNSNHRDT